MDKKCSTKNGVGLNGFKAPLASSKDTNSPCLRLLFCGKTITIISIDPYASLAEHIESNNSGERVAV